MAQYKLSLFIFTRDLRLEDNTSLITALKSSEKVLPVFIFNPEQISEENSYKSDNCVQFMIECLEELDEELRKKSSRLFYFYGDNITIIKKIIKETIDDAYYQAMMHGKGPLADILCPKHHALENSFLKDLTEKNDLFVKTMKKLIKKKPKLWD